MRSSPAWPVHPPVDPGLRAGGVALPVLPLPAGLLSVAQTRPLAGRTVVVTRPAAQAATLASWITAAGGAPLLFPLLDIGPPPDPQPLAEAATVLSQYALAAFVSPNAVDYSLPALLAAGPWPAGLVAAAVGQGTLRALAAHGIQGVAPATRFDSEALLELPELQAGRVAGQRVAIFRGDGGRELLADTLRLRGARVDCVTCYRRSAPSSIAPLLQDMPENPSGKPGSIRRIDALTISSSEGLRHLWDLLDAHDRAWLCRLPLFVPHARIAENAAALGAQHLQLTEPADAGIIAALCAYNWP